ncbi:MAG TPA: flagellar biosynthetic protein FliO [Steroidobacteraceae bacterium]|nr:flagellar biosynthetic protein FliO [Steroidobacteraceae bacterium]
MSHLFAAPHAATTAAPVGAGGLASVTLALLVVLADIPLGPKERAVLLKVGSEQILVGVAPGRVSPLHVLREPIEVTKSPTATTPAATSFSALLKRSLGK